MTQYIETALPFDGFYNSLYDRGIDQEIEQTVEYLLDENPKVDSDKIGNIVWGNINCQTAFVEIAKIATITWLDNFEIETGISLPGAKFKAMESPREYNFETDRIFANVLLKSLFGCYNLHKDDGFKTLAAVVKERHSHRSGFVSFYPTNLDKWFEKPLPTWDANEIQTLLIAAVQMATGDSVRFNQDATNETHEYCSGNEYYADCIDWVSVEKEMGALTHPTENQGA